jgi:DHA2 family multidrug resistance protein
MTTVPLSTIMFRFLPADQTSNAAGIYALVRNEGGSIGIAISSTFLERASQTHQAYLAANLSPSNPIAARAAQAFAAAHGSVVSSGSAANNAYAGLAMLYGQVQRQAALVLLLKRPPRHVGKIELDAH